ncbi:hypothetical protein DB346_08030 [Verrucomicrobia bacterium LW23]|nr:hypothetical protein DB346_08030 [Verrucomicrobia bacterium LW23]
MQQLNHRYVLFVLLGALAYGVIGWLSLRFALTLANCSAVWVLSGLCIGALARFGSHYWPAVFLGPLVLNTVIALIDGVSVPMSLLSGLGVALAEVGEAMVGAHFARKYFGTPPQITSPATIFTLLFWVCFVPAVVSMSGGVLSTWLTGILATENVAKVMVMWTLANVAGTMTCAPLFFVPSWRGWMRERLRFRVWESLTLVAVLVLMVLAISGYGFSFSATATWIDRWPKSWLAVPLMLWISTRLGRRTTMVAVLFIMVTGVAQTMRGFPVFPAEGLEQSYLGLQLFIVMVSVLGLTVSTQAHQLEVERRAMENVLAGQMRLESAMKERAVINASAVHDLQSPLHGIRNLLEYARSTPERLSGPDRESLLADMQSSVDRMLTLVGSTLAPVRAERAAATLEECDIAAIVRRVLDGEAAAAATKGITIYRRLPAEPLTLCTQATAVEHIVANFVSNAIKFSPRDSKVFVAVEVVEAAEHREICISVADEGPGISEDDRAEIFSGKILTNGAKPTAGETSNGLGLYLAGNLAQRLGARVTCEAGESGGSVFSVWLNRAS